MSSTESLAHDTRTTTAERAEHWRAIQQRTTRGMLTYNTHRVHHLEDSLWAVPSSRGGFHRVDLEPETCDCEDFTYFGADNDVACRHIVAAAIARATRARMSRATLRYLEERLAHELMPDEERCHLADQVHRLRRRLGH